jgi:two-component system sensor histidine kinase/response regulator
MSGGSAPGRQRRSQGEGIGAGDAARRLTAEYVTARALVESATLAEAVPRILQAICEALGWEHGALWVVDARAGVLRCVETWHRPEVSFPEFERASRATTFAPGIGLPGRVWESARAAWIPDVGDDANFPRAPIARREGLHAALGFPVMHDGAVRSVLEFFSREIREPDEDLLHMLGTVGSQIGLFLERRRAEEELQGFFTLSLDLFCIAGMNGRLLRVNPAWRTVLGHDEAELLERPYLDLVHPDDREATAAEAARLARGEPIVSFENRYRCKDGTYRWLLWMASPAPDRVSIYAAAHDVTGRKEAEAALTRYAREQEESRRILEEQTARQTQLMRELMVARRRAEEAAEAKGEFLANMSHEIRTPLNAILGMTELTIRSRLTAEQREYLGAVKSSSQALLSIVNDVLDFSKIEARRLELEHAPFDVREVIGDAARMFAFRAEEKGLELACHVAPGVPETVIGDPGRLRQVLVNLIGNGIKFTEKGEVVLAVENERGARGGQARLHFSVRDTGVGVPPERRDRIFDAFVQADSSTTRRFGGTGLGLTIAARLVELMEGKIWLEGNAEGGTTFHFTARLAVPPKPEAPRPPARASVIGDLRVLVVDDNATNRRILEEMLSSWHLRPVTVDSGKAALAALAAPAGPGERFDLVLTDYQMPAMHGLTLARRIRKVPGHARTPVILLTSVGRPNDVARSRELGLAACLTKPVKHSDLLEAIVAACGAKGAARRAVRGQRSPALAARALRVLVAEDNPVNRRLVVALLRKRGHRVTTAVHGGEAVAALERAGRGGFDLVIMDVQMPVMGGFEAAAAIRAREETTGGHVPILALTAHAMKGDRERCLAAGMDAYLPKPIDVDELVRTVEALGDAPATPGRDGAGEGDGPGDRDGAVVRRAPRGRAGAKPFDEKGALARTGGDRALLAEVVKLFRADAPRTVRRMERALGRADGEELRQAAHALKGSAATIGGDLVRDLALDLEQIGASGDLAAGPAALAALRAGLAGLEEALVASGFGPAGRKGRPASVRGKR